MVSATEEGYNKAVVTINEHKKGFRLLFKKSLFADVEAEFCGMVWQLGRPWIELGVD